MIYLYLSDDIQEVLNPKLFLQMIRIVRQRHINLILIMMSPSGCQLVVHHRDGLYFFPLDLKDRHEHQTLMQ